jgi:hypothetical protein
MVKSGDPRQRGFDHWAVAGEPATPIGGEHREGAAGRCIRETLLEQHLALITLAALGDEVVDQRPAERAGQHQHESGRDHPGGDREPGPANARVGNVPNEPVHSCAPCVVSAAAAIRLERKVGGDVVSGDHQTW